MTRAPSVKNAAFKLATFADSGGSMTPAAQAVVDHVRWMSEANNLAISVFYAAERDRFALARVLADPKATRVFLRNLRRCAQAQVPECG